MDLCPWGGQDPGYWVTWGIEVCAYCSVNLFALVSGYLNCEKKLFSSYRIVQLLISVLFYSTVITIAFALLDRSVFSGLGTVAIALCPMLTGRYWYITCYIVVFLLMPYLNLVINRLNTCSLKKLCLLLFVVLSVLPSLAGVDFFKLGYGYSSAWLIVCYIWGAAYRKINLTLFRRFELPVCIVSAGVVLLLHIIGVHSPFGTGDGYMLAYTSPFIAINAVMLLQLGTRFEKHLQSNISKFISYLSGVSFDVYLLHCHILIFDYIIADRFIWISGLHPLLIPVAVAVCAIVIYAAGSISAEVRKGAFRVAKIDTLIFRLATMVDKLLVTELCDSECDDVG